MHPLRLPNRQDMTQRTGEAWRPRAFVRPKTGFVAELSAKLRRFLDLQAGAGWNDLRQLLLPLEGVVLDVGCGAQPYRPLVNPRATYIGIDTADARANFDYDVPDVRYFTGDRWPVDDASVDVVLCTETMEHVPDTMQFLGEMARVTKPGGRLLATVPFAARWHYIPHDYWRFTPSSLTRVLNAAGFENVVVYARGNAVTVACYKAMALVLPFLFPTSTSAAIRVLLRFIGLLLSPLLVALAIVANISLRFADGDDCLGYTFTARRRLEGVAP